MVAHRPHRRWLRAGGARWLGPLQETGALMLSILSIGFFVVGLALAYAFVLRPLLHSQPTLADYYSRADSFWAALGAKLSGVRTKLAAGLLMLASFLVTMHDFLLPFATGIDWTPITQLLPAWAWPVLSLALGA